MLGEINLRKERVSEIIAYFRSDVKSVWNVVTNNLDYGWRSDIDHIEVLPGEKEWIEYSNDGKATNFMMTKKEKYKKYEFNMGNKMFTGYWTGHFSETENGGTKVIFTENIFIKNPIVHYISYFIWDLKKIQNIYIVDLKKKLGEI